MQTNPYPIYVIDDSHYDLLIASELIQEYCTRSVNIQCFADPEEALRQLKVLETTPDQFPKLLFLDIRMTLMDGFSFLDAYTKLPAKLTRHCKLYMLSSSLDPKDVQKAKANPLVVDFLEKPLEESFLKSLFLH